MKQIASACSLIATALLLAAHLGSASGVTLRSKAAVSDREIEQGLALAKRLCTRCHAFSPPEILPRDSWRGEIGKMAMIVEGRPLPGWGEPPPPVTLSEEYRRVLVYYEDRAPASLPAPDAWPAPDAFSRRFVRRPIGFKDALTREPAVANVLLANLDGDGRVEALLCDMRQGQVLMARPYAADAGAVPLAAVPHPSHVALVDLDRDGRNDLLVSDLGEFLPGDHEMGAAVWLRARGDGGYTPFAAGGAFARVADVEAADLDGDGRLDLVVAAFGWNRKGEIAVLFNRTVASGAPLFERRKIDDRHGAIHVVPTDFDGDGKTDFVALIAQEHEAVVAFLGDGKGGFRAETIYSAPHPNWGSTGIQLVDLDADRDVDVIVTNGDMFDDDLLKPYHGIQWLENKGRLRFEPHPLAKLAGAHRAVAADLDRDGDLDVVAAAFTGGVAGAAEARLPSLVWLEQVGRRGFERHTIEVGNATHATLDVGDIDGDGDLDVVTGAFLLRSTSDVWLDVWENTSTTTPAAGAGARR